MVCAICLENLNTNIIILRCNHQYHKSCLDRWQFQYKSKKRNKEYKKCPCCRRKIKFKKYKLFNCFRSHKILPIYSESS